MVSSRVPQAKSGANWEQKFNLYSENLQLLEQNRALQYEVAQLRAWKERAVTHMTEYGFERNRIRQIKQETITSKKQLLAIQNQLKKQYEDDRRNQNYQRLYEELQQTLDTTKAEAQDLGLRCTKQSQQLASVNSTNKSIHQIALEMFKKLDYRPSLEKEKTLSPKTLTDFSSFITKEIATLKAFQDQTNALTLEYQAKEQQCLELEKEHQYLQQQYAIEKGVNQGLEGLLEQLHQRQKTFLQNHQLELLKIRQQKQQYRDLMHQARQYITYLHQEFKNKFGFVPQQNTSETQYHKLLETLRQFN